MPPFISGKGPWAWKTFVTMHLWTGWIVLLGLVSGIGLGISRHLKGEPNWEPGYYRAAAFALDFQVLLGVILYFGKDGYDQGTFIAVFHPLLMLLAVAVAHLGLRYASAHLDESPDRIVGYAYFVSLVLVIAAIPWERITA